MNITTDIEVIATELKYWIDFNVTCLFYFIYFFIFIFFFLKKWFKF